MGTRMVSAAESPVHDAYKQLIVGASETGSRLLNRFARPAFRVLQTPHTDTLERHDPVPLNELGGQLALYFDGDLDAGLAFGGQVAGRIDAVKPVADILRDTITEFDEVMQRIADTYVGAPHRV
jgi:enoyl-[acyl-carrier protein] reductase II